jgi:hypothetical protein
VKVIFETSSRTWEYNIKIEVNEIAFEDLGYVQWILDSIQLWDFVKIIVKLPVH